MAMADVSPVWERTVAVLDHGVTPYTGNLRDEHSSIRDMCELSPGVLEQIVFPVSTKALGMTSGDGPGEMAATFTFSSQQEAERFLDSNQYETVSVFKLPSQAFQETNINVGLPENSLNMCALFGVSFDRRSNSISGPWYRIQALWDHLQKRTDFQRKWTVSTVIRPKKAEYVKEWRPKGVFPKCEGCEVRFKEHETFSEVTFIGGSEQKCNKAKKHFENKMKKIEIVHSVDGPVVVGKHEDRQTGCISAPRKSGQRKNSKNRKSEADYPYQIHEDTTSTLRERDTQKMLPNETRVRGSRKLDENKYNDWVDKSRVSPVRHASAPQPTTFQSRINTNAYVHVLQHDITRLRVDVIVNAANAQLQHGAGVARAIADAAGRDLERACQNWVTQKGPICVTQHAWTVGGRLPCREVMHAVGPIYSAHTHKQCEKQLYDTFYHCLYAAAGKGYTSIAFPAISSGVFGFPQDRVASNAAQSVSDYLAKSETTLTQIFFVDVLPEMVHYLIKAFTENSNIHKRARFYGNQNGQVIGMDGAGMPASPRKSPQKVLAPVDHGNIGQAQAGATSPPHTSPAKAWPATTSTAESMSFMSTRNLTTKIHALRQDITKLDVDVIVNASNPSLIHRAGVSKVIESAAGPDMQQECKSYVAAKGQLRVGEHAKTGPGNLKCSMVFHAVGPTYNTRDTESYKRDLSTTVTGCLNDAKSVGYASIAFPSIGSGHSGAPLGVVSEVMADSICKHLYYTTSLRDIYLVDISDEMVAALQNALYDRSEARRQFEGGGRGELRYLPVNKSAATGIGDLGRGQGHLQGQMQHQMQGQGQMQGQAQMLDQWQKHGSQMQGQPQKQDQWQMQGQGHMQGQPQKRDQWQMQGYGQTQGQTKKPYQQNDQLWQTRNDQDYTIPNGHHQKQGQGMQGHELGRPKAYQSPVRQVAAFPATAAQASVVVTSPPRAVSTIMVTGKSVKGAENCSICMCPPDNPKTLPQCKHTFCTTCIDNWFATKPSCPICGMVYGKLTGTQPRNGTMDVEYQSASIPGFEGHGCNIIKYNFPNGIQSEEHPNPGQPYKGLRRQAYLPDTSKGRQALQLLQEAFKARLVFTIGRSVTTGQENVLTWNDIHHKTSVTGGPQRFGYPDPTYLDRLMEELAAKGIK